MAGDPGRILADVLAFHAAFAFNPETEEPPDHVAVEAAFLGYLRLKEAYAACRKEGEGEAEVTAEAARRFCESHLAGLAPWPRPGPSHWPPVRFSGESGPIPARSDRPPDSRGV